jgi:hypothetical protein
MFYPLLKILGFEGMTTLSNFPPNDWESKDLGTKIIHVLWSDGKLWHTKVISDLLFGQNLSVSTKDLGDEILQNNLAFLFPSTIKLPELMDSLPQEKRWMTHVPAWRATIGIKSETAQTSYQGEIEPFPDKASLLTFHPFLQFGDFKNYFLTINLQNSPGISPSDLEIFNSSDKKFIDFQSIKRNSATVIPLDNYNFSPTDLPVFINKEMSAIPFGFGHSTNGHMLSLEHTHPPASLVLHGNRMVAQSGIKSSWFRKLLNNDSK